MLWQNSLSIIGQKHENLINLFFATTNCQIVCSCLLTHHINYKFMCLFTYWQWKLVNEPWRISAVIGKCKLLCLSQMAVVPRMSEILWRRVFFTIMCSLTSLYLCILMKERLNYLKKSRFDFCANFPEVIQRKRHLRVIMRVTYIMISMLHRSYQDVATYV